MEARKQELSMEPSDIREEAKRLVESLPAHATWDDLMHQIYVRKTIEKGLAQSHAGKTTEVSEVRKRFGISQ
jgi:hypothetical protein